MNVILEGIVGSKAYGMDTPESDEDRLGVFMAPVSELLGLGWSNNKESVVKTNPDVTYHELGKFCRLALKANPTITELLWIPDHTIRTSEGSSLIYLRKSFLSTRYVRDAYGGYAKQQVKKLLQRGDSFSSDTKNRTAKHARHVFRLLFQGIELLSTGHLTVNVGEEVRQYCFEMGELATVNVDRFVSVFEDVDCGFQNVADESVLPEQPEFKRVNDFLVKARLNQSS